jgi:hypothetical protein
VTTGCSSRPSTAKHVNIVAVLVAIMATSLIAYGQPASVGTVAQEPALPVIDVNACPFEGCRFGKWLVIKKTVVYDTWKQNRKIQGTLDTGATVTALTGVHITLQPDRIRVTKAIAELGVQPGDIILRSMYIGEGFADIWVKGRWVKEYDCSFVTEPDDSGCARNCSARVITVGRKEWWVSVRDAKGVTGWTKVEDQFGCIDALADDPRCEHR